MQKTGRESSRFVDRTGEEHINNQACKFTIIEHFSNINSTIKFEDNTIVQNVKYCNIKKGNVQNHNWPSYYSLGFIGVGKYLTKFNGKHTKEYSRWTNILRRCYDIVDHVKNPTYIPCSVDKRWHNFQVFAKWFENNYEPHMEGWEIDKDILIKGNKVYSPENCCFVPRQINNIIIKSDKSRGDLPIGVTKVGNKYIAQCNTSKKGRYIGSFDTPEEAFYAYKEVKENYIKEIAEIWKNKIPEKVYQAMYNWIVEITD